jgi:virginiamycin A acetyltransferase
VTLQIHESAWVSPSAEIEDSVRGSEVTIAAHSHIDAFVRIRAAGGSGSIRIGERCYINAGCVLYIGNGITIGNFVSIGANCVLAPTNHNLATRSVPIQFQGFMPSRGGILIEDDVWIGAGSVVLDGSIIRRGAVIGALSLVRGEVSAYSIMGGNPLRKLGERP